MLSQIFRFNISRQLLCCFIGAFCFSWSTSSPALGDGPEAYFQGVWSASSTDGGETRGMYVDGFDNILGNSQSEISLLEYANNNGVTYLALYDLHYLLDRGEDLAKFIQLAKNSYGIVQVGACGSTEDFFDAVVSLNENYSCGFDVLNLEYEFWNHDPRDFSVFKSLLEHMNEIAAQRNLLVEAYIGWPTEEEAREISTLVDRLLVHCYVQDAAHAFGYAEERLSWLADVSDPLEVWPIYSAEASFMGPWLDAHSMDEAQSAFMADYGEVTDEWKNGVKVTGFQYFTYGELTPAPVRPNIKANGEDGPVAVSHLTEVSITLDLDPGGRENADADLWVAVAAPFDPPANWYSYGVSSDWTPGIGLCARVPLFSFSEFQVLKTRLPAGAYTFYFGIDDPDGAVNASWWGIDFVTVNVN